MGLADSVFQMLQGSEVLTILLSLSAKSIVVLSTAAFLDHFVRKATARLRHMLWCAALWSLLILPFFSGDLHLLRVPVLPSNLANNISAQKPTSEDESSGTITSTSEIARTASSQVDLSAPEQNFSFPSIIFSIWLLGVLLVVVRFVVGIAMVRSLVSRASELTGTWSKLLSELSQHIGLKRPVRLLRSDRGVMPMTCGGLSATVLLPVGADEWSSDRRRVVLLHELIHIKRRDILTQTVAHLVCALYWFNPLVWLALKKMRTEQEWACDESVVATGVAAPDYAGHLMEIARAFRSNAMSTAATTGMAASTQLQDRLCAILSPGHQHLWSVRTIAATAVMGFVLVSTAVVQLVPAQSQDDLPYSNVVHDRIRVEQSDGLAQIKQRSAKVAVIIDKDRASEETPLATPTPLDQPSKTEPPVHSEVAIDSQRNDQAVSGFTAEEWDRLASQGIGPAYIQEMASAGYSQLTVDQLIRLYSNSVRADYVAGLRSVGYDSVSIRDLLSLKTNGITPDVIRSYQAVKHAGIEAKRYVALVSNGVTPSYWRSLADTGYDSLSANKAIEMRRAGITAEFIGDARSRGYVNLSPNDLIELKRSARD